MGGAIARAGELVAETPNAWMPQQFENEANLRVHRETTAQEIVADFPEGIDFLVTVSVQAATSPVVPKLCARQCPISKCSRWSPRSRRYFREVSPGHIRFKGSARDSFRRYWTLMPSDEIVQVAPPDAMEMAAVVRKRKGSWSAFPPAPRSPQLHKNYRTSRPVAGSLGSTTIPANGTFPSRDSCRPSRRLNRTARIQTPTVGRNK